MPKGHPYKKATYTKRPPHTKNKNLKIFFRVNHYLFYLIHNIKNFNFTISQPLNYKFSTKITITISPHRLRPRLRLRLRLRPRLRLRLRLRLGLGLGYP